MDPDVEKRADSIVTLVIESDPGAELGAALLGHYHPDLKQSTDAAINRDKPLKIALPPKPKNSSGSEEIRLRLVKLAGDLDSLRRNDPACGGMNPDKLEKAIEALDDLSDDLDNP